MISNTLLPLFMKRNMATNPSPDINDCVDLYLYAWDRFGERHFSVKQLTEQLADRDICFLDGKDEVQRHLDLLSEYGLLNHDDGQYWFQCMPDEDLSAWRERTPSPEAIYQLVQQAKRQREHKSSPHSLEVLEYKDEVFVSVLADKNMDRSDLTTLVTNRMNQSSTFDGVVIRSLADQIGYIQQLADELCDIEVMTETDLSCYFEKIISHIRGDHKDDLEYHLYLRSEL
jgi:hypothetical protein